MGLQVVVDLDPPGERDPVSISLALAYGCALPRLSVGVTCGAEGASCIYAKRHCPVAPLS